MSQRGFFRPENAWVGDLIPWQADGEFHLFHLHETRATPKEGMPWRRVITRNLIDFEDAGVARKDVQTTGLSMSPVYDYHPYDPPTLTGYRVSQRASASSTGSTVIASLVASPMQPNISDIGNGHGWLAT